MKWLVIAIRILRNWSRLEKEGLEALRSALEVAQAARLNMRAGDIASSLRSEELRRALVEMAEAVEVIEEILDV